MSGLAFAVVLAAVLLPGLLYLRLAIRESRLIHTVEDFLPLKRNLSARSVSATVVAAGMSMATVMVALINLAPFIGVALFVTIATYAVGFVLLAFLTRRILDANPRNLVLQTYLSEAYGSGSLGFVATGFTVIGYLSIFAMELLVGTAILTPILGNWTLAFATVYLGFLLAYCALSGYRGVVATDRWQLLFILLAVASLIAFVLWNYVTYGIDASFNGSIVSSLFTWKGSLAFVIGVTVMNIPGPISDTGTWQRICSAESPRAARAGIRAAVFLFVFIWSTLIVVGCLHPTLRHLDGSWDAATTPLMTGIIDSLAGPGHPILLGLLFLLILGLFSAMISTADSLLLAAGQAALTGFRGTRWMDDAPSVALRRSRLWIIVLAVGSFVVFVVFHLLSFNVIQLVFAIYGAQLALWPTTVATLIFRNHDVLRPLRTHAIVSIASGFLAAWGCAIWGHSIASSDLQFYAPAVGLGTALVTIIPGVVLAVIRSRTR